MYRSPRSRLTTRFVAVIAVASLTLAGCAADKKKDAKAPASASSVTTTASAAPAPATGKKPKIGLVMKSLSNEFFQQMQKGAQTYADENKDKFEFKSVGMKDERDFAAQVSAVENFICR